MGVFSKLPEGCGLFAKVTIEKGDIICDSGGDLLDKAAGYVIASDESRVKYIFAFCNGMTDKEMYYDNYHHTMNIECFINHLSCTEDFQGIRFFFIIVKYRNYHRCSRNQYRLMLHLMFHLLERSVKLCKDVR